MCALVLAAAPARRRVQPAEVLFQGVRPGLLYVLQLKITNKVRPAPREGGGMYWSPRGTLVRRGRATRPREADRTKRAQRVNERRDGCGRRAALARTLAGPPPRPARPWRRPSAAWSRARARPRGGRHTAAEERRRRRRARGVVGGASTPRCESRRVVTRQLLRGGAPRPTEQTDRPTASVHRDALRGDAHDGTRADHSQRADGTLIRAALRSRPARATCDARRRRATDARRSTVDRATPLRSRGRRRAACGSSRWSRRTSG